MTEMFIAVLNMSVKTQSHRCRATNRYVVVAIGDRCIFTVWPRLLYKVKAEASICDACSEPHF